MARCVICFGQILKVNWIFLSLNSLQVLFAEILDDMFRNSHLLAEIDGWGLSPRGAGYLFGGDVVEKVFPERCNYLCSHFEHFSKQ